MSFFGPLFTSPFWYSSYIPHLPYHFTLSSTLLPSGANFRSFKMWMISQSLGHLLTGVLCLYTTDVIPDQKYGRYILLSFWRRNICQTLMFVNHPVSDLHIPEFSSQTWDTSVIVQSTRAPPPFCWLWWFPPRNTTFRKSTSGAPYNNLKPLSSSACVFSIRLPFCSSSTKIHVFGVLIFLFSLPSTIRCSKSRRPENYHLPFSRHWRRLLPPDPSRDVMHNCSIKLQIALFRITVTRVPPHDGPHLCFEKIFCMLTRFWFLIMSAYPVWLTRVRCSSHCPRDTPTEFPHSAWLRSEPAAIPPRASVHCNDLTLVSILCCSLIVGLRSGFSHYRFSTLRILPLDYCQGSPSLLIGSAPPPESSFSFPSSP